MSLIISQYPSDTFYAINTVPEIVIEATETALVELYFCDQNAQWENTNRAFFGSYAPDFNQEIRISFNELYQNYISSLIPTEADTLLVHSQYWYYFRAVVTDENGTQQVKTWRVCNARFKSTVAWDVWSEGNFLTNQPSEKRTNDEAPEWLTWFDADGNKSLIARFYPKAGGHIDVTVQTDTNPGCYSANVSYNRLIRLLSVLPSQLLGYYDLILSSSKLGEACCQRYIYEERTGREKYFLFVNALGGIDTLICQGANVLSPDVTYNIGRFLDRYEPLDDTDDRRQWRQETGMVARRERNWIYELLTAKRGARQFDPERGLFHEIVLNASDIAMSDHGQLASASFSYIMNDIVDVVADAERDKSLHQSVADQADSMEDISSQVSLAMSAAGGGGSGYATEVAQIEATKLYVEWVSAKVMSSAPVYYLINGSSAGSFTPGVTSMPAVITKASNATIQFTTADPDVSTIIVKYYPEPNT